MDSEYPVRMLKILILFCNQFKGFQLTSLVADYIQVELTYAGRMPQEMEDLLADSIMYGLEDEEILEDTVQKIADFRMLFGAGEFQSGRQDSLSSLNSFVEQQLSVTKMAGSAKPR